MGHEVLQMVILTLVYTTVSFTPIFRVSLHSKRYEGQFFLVTLSEVFYAYHQTIVINLIIVSLNQVLGFFRKNSMLGKIQQQ